MYMGYAIDHEGKMIYPIVSGYKNRDSVRDNVERCIMEQEGVRVHVSPRDVVVRTPGAAEGLHEEIELLASDLVRGGHGVDAGYEVCPRAVDVRPRETRAEAAARDEREREEREFAERGADAPASKEDQFFALAEFGETCAGRGISYRVTSLCLWFEGDTKPVRDYLKAMGCRWSGKRQAWYWRIPQAA